MPMMLSLLGVEVAMSTHPPPDFPVKLAAYDWDFAP
eukprot:COSAG01_NODE_616_length_14815_cov_8.518076_16_plen_36_part_00